MPKYLFTILISLIVLILSVTNTSGLPVKPIVFFDKIVHLCMYAAVVLGFFADKIRYNSLKFNYLTIIILTTAYGGVIEIIQHFLPYRSAEIWDFIFDCLGGIIGILAGIILIKSIKKKRQDTN